MNLNVEIVVRGIFHEQDLILLETEALKLPNHGVFVTDNFVKVLIALLALNQSQLVILLADDDHGKLLVLFVILRLPD